MAFQSFIIATRKAQTGKKVFDTTEMKKSLLHAFWQYKGGANEHERKIG